MAEIIKDLNIKINVDTSELDEAITKLREFSGLTDRMKAKALLLEAIEHAAERYMQPTTAPETLRDIADAVDTYCSL